MGAVFTLLNVTVPTSLLGISFQRLVRTEHGLSPEIHCSKTMWVHSNFDAKDKHGHCLCTYKLLNYILSLSWHLRSRDFLNITALPVWACSVCVSFISTVLLVSPDEDVPPEVQSVSELLSSTHSSSRDVNITLILHGIQAALGSKYDLQALRTALQVTDQCLNV